MHMVYLTLQSNYLESFNQPKALLRFSPVSVPFLAFFPLLACELSLALNLSLIVLGPPYLASFSLLTLD